MDIGVGGEDRGGQGQALRRDVLARQAKPVRQAQPTGDAAIRPVGAVIPSITICHIVLGCPPVRKLDSKVEDSQR